jgi:hypothetical protein
MATGKPSRKPSGKTFGKTRTGAMQPTAHRTRSAILLLG